MRPIIIALALSASGCAQLSKAARAIAPAVKRMTSCVAECIADELGNGAPLDGGVK